MDDEPIELNEKQKKARSARNIAIAVLLGVLVVIFYVVTILKIGPQIMNRPL